MPNTQTNQNQSGQQKQGFNQDKVGNNTRKDEPTAGQNQQRQQ